VASENERRSRQRTATIHREQTAKNATNAFKNSNNPNVLGFKHLVDIEGVTGSIPVAPTININDLAFPPNRHSNDNGNDCPMPLWVSFLRRLFQRCFDGPGDGARRSIPAFS
jgi:hypothetical protein